MLPEAAVLSAPVMVVVWRREPEVSWVSRGSSARMGRWSQRCRLQGPTERLGRGGE